MTQYLPPNLLALFAAREPIPFKPPVDKLPHEKRRNPYPGVADSLKFFEKPEETPEPVKPETREERRERKRKEKAELQAFKVEQGIALWEPQNNESATHDPYKSLFVARINYETSESKLRREFETYGPISKVIMCTDAKTGKPRGYAFIEYEREKDMHSAYKHADGRKIDNRRVLVDVERGRTVKGWLPRRLGGGLGNTRKARDPNAEDDQIIDRRREDSRRSSDRDRGRDRERERGGDRDRGERRSRDRDRERDRGGDRSGDRDAKRPRRDDDRDRDRERDRGADRGRERGAEDRDRDRGRDRDRDRDRRDDYKREEYDREPKREEREIKQERYESREGGREPGELDHRDDGRDGRDHSNGH